VYGTVTALSESEVTLRVGTPSLRLRDHCKYVSLTRILVKRRAARLSKSTASDWARSAFILGGVPALRRHYARFVRRARRDMMIIESKKVVLQHLGEINSPDNFSFDAFLTFAEQTCSIKKKEVRVWTFSSLLEEGIIERRRGRRPTYHIPKTVVNVT
jgi:hypothetical protein